MNDKTEAFTCQFTALACDLMNWWVYASFQVLIFFSSVSVQLMELLDLCHELFSANEECAECQRTSGFPRHTIHFPHVPGSG